MPPPPLEGEKWLGKVSRFVYASVIRGGGERLGKGLPLCLCYCHPQRWRKAWERAPALLMLLPSAEVEKGLGNSSRSAHATVIRGGRERLGTGLPLSLSYCHARRCRKACERT